MGKHTKSGRALLSNDPHLPNGMPSFWHASQIEYPDGSYIVGSAPPGISAYGSFATDKLAVGITTVHVDNSDIYEEKIEGDSYWFKGELLPLTIREEVIKVKGKEPIRYEVRSTHHGPIMGDYAVALKSLRNVPPVLPKGDFSLAWIGLNPEEDTSFETFLGAYDANDVFEMTEKLVGIKREETTTKKEDIIKPAGFTQNVVFADHKGNVAYTLSGSLVKRFGDNRNSGIHISEGWTGENEWDGVVAPEERPYLINPKKGYVMAANGPTSPIDIDSPVVAYMGLQPRSTRIDSLLSKLVKEKSGSITVEDMKEVLGDVTEIISAKSVKHLIQITEGYTKNLKDTSEEHKKAQDVLEILKTWQGEYKIGK